MTSKFGWVLGLALAAAPVAAFAQPLPRAVRLEEIGPCVWSRIDAQTQNQLVEAFAASVEDYARASAAAGPRLSGALPQCWTPSPGDQFAASYIAGMGVTQEVLAQLIARDESIGRTQLDAAIAQAPAPLRDQLMRTAHDLYNGQRSAPPAMTAIFQSLGLSVDPAYLQSPRGRRVSTYIGQTFQILVAATEPAPAARKRAVELPDMGRCVWEQLTPAEREPFIAATEAGNSQAFQTAESALSRRTFALALECTPSMVADQTSAGKMMSLALRAESNAVLINREAAISRDKLDVTLAAAPPSQTASLQQAATAMIRQQPLPPPQPIDGLFEALGQPMTPEFRTSKLAQRITTYYLYVFSIRALAAQFGQTPVPGAAVAPRP